MTAISRRGFLQSAAFTSAGAALAATPFESLWAREAAPKLASQSLGPQLSLITGGGGNVLALGSAEGALLVDGGARAQSGALLKLALQSVGAKKVHTLFNTHWHPDQTGSNETLGRQGARIIAHENTRLWLTRKIVVDWAAKPFPAFPKVAQPNKSFYTTDKLEFGGEQISYGHLGQAHTDGDLYVYLPKANVLVTGGVVSSAGWPLLDWQTGGWIGGLVGAQDRLLKLANRQHAHRAGQRPDHHPQGPAGAARHVFRDLRPPGEAAGQGHGSGRGLGIGTGEGIRGTVGRFKAVRARLVPQPLGSLRAGRLSRSGLRRLRRRCRAGMFAAPCLEHAWWQIRSIQRTHDGKPGALRQVERNPFAQRRSVFVGFHHR